MTRLATAIAGQTGVPNALRRVGVEALLVFALGTTPSAQTSAPDQLQRAFFEIDINGTGYGDMLVYLASDDVWVPAELFERAGLEQVTGLRRELNARTFVSLKSLAPGITYELDESALVIKLTATSQTFGVNIVSLDNERPPDIEYAGRPTVFVNYGLNYRDTVSSDAAAELGANLGRLLFSTTASAMSKGHVIRGVSQMVYDDQRRMRRFTIGDRFVSSGLLGGSALVGGVTVSRDFGLDPYFVRYPTLDFSGAVTTPSTVEVYVNDRLVTRTQIAPGEFQLRRVPVQSGSGDTRLVIRDAFGRSREIASPYYLTTSLLSAGVHDYTYSLGWERQETGVENWNYGRPVLFGEHRAGVTSALTLGVRGEASQDVWNFGPTMNIGLARFGELELAAARSRSGGVYGTAGSGGYAYNGRPFNIGTVARYATPLYATTSQAPLDPKSRFEVSSSFGVLLGPLFAITAQHDVVENYPSVLAERTRTRTGLTFSSRLSRRLNLFVAAARSRLDRVRSREASVSLSLTFGRRTIASVSAEDGPNGQRQAFEIQQSRPIGEGMGYRFRTEIGDNPQTDARIAYNTAVGRYEAEYQRRSSTQSGLIGVSGGLVAIDGRLFATRPVEESFAVVKVPGVAGVRTFASNQEVGRTGRGGYLLVPNLLPYYGNVLSISDTDVPFEYALDRVRRVVAPPFRGGALVTFAAVQRHAVTGTLALESRGETTIPAYGELAVDVAGQTVESPIGQQGEFYLDGVVGGKYPARILYRGQTCAFTLDVPSSTGPVVRIGSVRCLVP